MPRSIVPTTCPDAYGSPVKMYLDRPSHGLGTEDETSFNYLSELSLGMQALGVREISDGMIRGTILFVCLFVSHLCPMSLNVLGYQSL